MNHASVNLDVAAMRTVFQCFDVNKLGGIDLQELQSAVKVLGISINPREVAKMFHAADTDGSGEVDFDEFTAIMHKSDGGAFARMIRKVHEDEACRDIMRSRMRPIQVKKGMASRVSFCMMPKIRKGKACKRLKFNRPSSMPTKPKNRPQAARENATG